MKKLLLVPVLMLLLALPAEACGGRQRGGRLRNRSRGGHSSCCTKPVSCCPKPVVVVCPTCGAPQAKQLPVLPPEKIAPPKE
jgi:hypothetical protein